MKTVKFSIDVINDYVNDDDMEFSTVKLKFLSCGENSHDYDISEEVLREYAHTILGKFIVGKFNKFTEDFQGHQSDEIIFGYIPKDAQITFEESDNGIFACTEGVISKLYATSAYEAFKKENGRSVSVEMGVKFTDTNDHTSPITSFNITGVTVLGMTIAPSCKLASMEVIKFSAQNAEKYYIDHQETTLVKFAKQRKKLLDKGSDIVEEEEKIENEKLSEEEIAPKEDEKVELSADENVDAQAQQLATEEQAEVNEEASEGVNEEAKMAEDKDNIIMAKDTEIAELQVKLSEQEAKFAEINTKFESQTVEFAKLQKFKTNEEVKAKNFAVDQVMSEVKSTIKTAQFEELRNEGLACDIANLDGFITKVKAVAFESMKGKKKSTRDGIWSTAFADENTKQTKNGLWD